jgi:hypothetical protein
MKIRSLPTSEEKKYGAIVTDFFAARLQQKLKII